MKVGIVGLGTMGADIAQVSIAAGHETVGREVSLELAERGRATIAHYLGRAVAKERLTPDERDTIARWDAEETSDRLELLLGPDLQFIRINGTVVGAAAGLALHTIAQLIG